MLEAWIQPAASTTRLPDRTRSGADAAHGRGGWSAARLKNGGKGSAHATVMERNINFPRHRYDLSMPVVAKVISKCLHYRDGRWASLDRPG